MSADSPQRLIPAGYAEVTHFLTATGDPTGYTIRFGVSSADVSVAGLEQVRIAAATAFQDNWEVALSDEFALSNTTVRGAVADGGFIVEGGPFFVGDDANDHLPQNCALIVEKVTALAGRGNRGRMFLPGILDDAAVNGNGSLDPTTYAAQLAAAIAWYTDLMAASAIDEVSIFHADFVRNPAVAHDDVTNPVYMIPNTVALLPTAVTSFSIDPVIGTQRRRLR